MKVLRLCWLGIPARDYEPMVHLLRDIMGLRVEFEESTTTELSLPSGDRIQVFSPDDPYSAFFRDHGHGPVALFEVDDAHAARAELIAAGVDVIGEIERDRTWEWLHLRGPDGNVYELAARHAGAPIAIDVSARGAALARVRAVIERLVGDGTAVSAADGSVHEIFPVAASAAEGQALRQWVVREGATRTIEVGLGYAISTLFICEGLLMTGAATVRHRAIDPFQQTRFADCGLQFLGEAGVAQIVEHHAEESQLVLPRLLSESRCFDLAFVDGNHRFDGVFLDLVYLGRLLRPGGIVFLDDYQLPAIARAVAFFVTNLDWTLEEISPADDVHQWAVVRTSAAPDTRAFDDYVDF